MAEPIRQVHTALPDGFPVTYFEQPCTRGCADEHNRPTMIAGATEEIVRQRMITHRNVSQCVERAHRYSQRVQSESHRAVREARAAEKVAADKPVSPPLPPKRAPKPSWKNAKKTTTIGWDGKPIV